MRPLAEEPGMKPVGQHKYRLESWATGDGPQRRILFRGHCSCLQNSGKEPLTTSGMAASWHGQHLLEVCNAG